MYKHIFSSLTFTLFLAACSPKSGDIQLLNKTKGDQNFAPRAFHASFQGEKNQAIKFMIPLGEDRDSLKQQLTYKIIKPPTSGLVDDKCLLQTQKHSARSCVYTADENFTGIDTLSYQIIDEQDLKSEVAHIDFFVTDSTNEHIFTKNFNSNDLGIDILWVIDSSNNTLPKREELQNNAISFLSEFQKEQNRNIRFRMAVLNSNSKESIDKSFLSRNIDGNIFDLTSELAHKDVSEFSANFVQAFELKKLNENKGRSLASIKKVVTNDNQWFKDPQKPLVVILLANTNEHSYPDATFPGNEKYLTAQDWLKDISKIKSNESLVHFFPIVDYKVTKSKTSSDLYDRYHHLAKYSGGEIYDINQPLEKTLNQISEKIIGHNSTQGLIFENAPIKPDSIEVWIDRKKLTADQWSYRGNKLFFKQHPNKKSYIQIKYKRL